MEKDIFYLRPEQKTFCIDKDFEVYRVRVIKYVGDFLNAVLIDDNDNVYDCDFIERYDLLPGYEMFYKIKKTDGGDYLINGNDIYGNFKRSFKNSSEENLNDYIDKLVACASKLGCPII